MYGKQLKFNPDGKFRILIFTDIHAKPDSASKKAALKNRDTFLFINTALDILKPDLVILGGDNCTDFNYEDGAERFEKVFDSLTAPFRERGIPFATVLGNHEHDFDDDRLEQALKAYDECPFCIAHNEFSSSKYSLNHHIIIKSSDEQKDAFVVWLMDSNNVIDIENRTVYDCVHRSQIDWYEKTAAELKEKNSGVPVPAILFQHIPVPEIYGTLRRPAFYELPVSERGHDILRQYRFVKGKTCSGYLGEGPDCCYYNEGQFASWKKTGDITAAFFGHDHMNDFHGVFDGITMGQCKTGGFWAYTDGCRTGTRLIDLNESDPRHIETKMIHFKELGLKSKSLGPIQKRITDRQSLTLHKLKWAAVGAAACAGAAALAGYIKK